MMFQRISATTNTVEEATAHSYPQKWNLGADNNIQRGWKAGESLLEMGSGGSLRYDTRAVVLTPGYEIARFKGILSYPRVRVHAAEENARAYLCLPEPVLLVLHRNTRDGGLGTPRALRNHTESRPGKLNCRKYRGSSNIRKVQR